MIRTAWLVALALAAGCHKEAAPPPTPAPAPQTAAPPANPEAKRALDDFDRWLAPVWKQPEDKRLAALCAIKAPLNERAVTLQKVAVAGVAPEQWQGATSQLAESVDALDLCCNGGAAACVDEVHKTFAAAIALVPGAAPIDRHKDDPPMTPTTTAPAPTKLRAALTAASAALSAAADAKPKTAAELCTLGHGAVAGATVLLGARDLEDANAVAPGLGEELGALAMNLGAFDAQYCPAGKPAALDDVHAALDGLAKAARDLLAKLP